MPRAREMSVRYRSLHVPFVDVPGRDRLDGWNGSRPTDAAPEARRHATGAVEQGQEEHVIGGGRQEVHIERLAFHRVELVGVLSIEPIHGRIAIPTYVACRPVVL